MTARAVIYGLDGPALTDREAAFFRAADPWGFILFGRNIEAPDQVRRLTSSLREAVGRDAPVLIDQEGGRVERMRPPYWQTWMPPLDTVLALNKRDAERAFWLRYRVISAELRDVGIDVNCAPVLDIAWPDTHPFLRNRCFGTDPGTVAAHGRIAADAMLAGGVVPVVKHMPGHGRSVVDSHADVPRITATRALIEDDFQPFRALADLPVAMTGHLQIDIFGPDPVTVSTPAISAIRNDIGFEGLLLTDDIAMEALDGAVHERAIAAWGAGCDIVLHCNGKPEEMDAIAEHAAPLSDRAQHASDQALSVRHAQDMVDTASLIAEYTVMMEGVSHAG